MVETLFSICRPIISRQKAELNKISPVDIWLADWCPGSSEFSAPLTPPGPPSSLLPPPLPSCRDGASSRARYYTYNTYTSLLFPVNKVKNDGKYHRKLLVFMWCWNYFTCSEERERQRVLFPLSHCYKFYS